LTTATFKIANGFRYVEPASGQRCRAFFTQPGASGAGKIEVEKASP
jgi:hypothetical protein